MAQAMRDCPFWAWPGDDPACQSSANVEHGRTFPFRLDAQFILQLAGAAEGG